MFCELLITLIALFFFADWLSLRLRGDCDLRINTSKIFNPTKTQSGQQAILTFNVHLENLSLKEQGLVIDGSVTLLPQNKETKKEILWIKMTLASSPRQDGYFEATLVKPGKSIPLRVELLLDNQESLKKIARNDKLDIEISYSYYGRRPIATNHVHFSLPIDIFQEKPMQETEPVQLTPVRIPKKSFVFPIPTHLIYPNEDLAKVILKYTDGKFKPGDWVAIAESVVAIAQGRVYSVYSIKPGFWAKRLNRFFQFDASMVSCYSMQCAIQEVGLPRILLAVIAGLAGKLIGRSGDFYRVAGRSVASIDDCTGTLPPFDKSVVLGPKDGNKVAEEIRLRTKFEVAIVDANDLQKVDILGKSNGIIDQEVIAALTDNPQGNADEQTPIVMIRR